MPQRLDPSLFVDVEIFDESGFWYKADFEDLTPYTLFRTFNPSDGIQWQESEFLCLSYPYKEKHHSPGTIGVKIC